MMVTVLYKCACMSNEGSFEVSARGRENVIQWMELFLRPALGADHMRRSPLCRALTVEYIKIPISNEEGARVGDPVTPKAGG